MRLIPLLRLALLLLPLAALAGPPAERPPGLRAETGLTRMPERIELPALDVARLRAEDAERALRREPPRYAVQKAVATVTPRADGEWESLPDGGRVWRYAVHAEGATSVEPGFTTFRLPEGAALYAHGNEGKRVRGPYTHEDNRDHGQLWVPIVEGDTATIELVLEPGVKTEDVSLALTDVLQGYVPFWEDDVNTKRTNECNVDVACEKDVWGDQIRSVAHVNISGNRCSGQMVNNTAFDRRPLFLTAFHCGVTQANAPSVKVYWNFENSSCREHDTTANGDRGDGVLDFVNEGAQLLTSHVSSDFSLVELDEAPDPDWDVHWTGWDRRDLRHQSGFTIHHPAGDEKRISLENNRFSIIDGDELVPNLLTQPQARPGSHYRVVWDRGVTEGGSSGGGLWNGEGRLVGQLHGGANHTCPETTDNFDWYGRLWASWDGGATPETRLREHLDPMGTADQFIDGAEQQCSAPSASINVSPGSPKVGDLVTFSATGPTGIDYAWDFDGDGIPDATGRTVSTRFQEAFQGDVTLLAADRGAACGNRIREAIQVGAPALRVANQSAQQLDGDDDDVPEPGERWELIVTLGNDGATAARNARAVFTRAGNVARVSESDGFGYRVTDSRSGDLCPFRFENIAASGNGVSFPDKDDGGSSPIGLSDFSFYGDPVAGVVMSTNGYLATSATRNGIDWNNKCPLPALPDQDPNVGSTGLGRLAAYHDDLVIDQGWSARFADCPRPPDAPGSTGACRIFQWNVGETLAGPSLGFNALPVEPFRFQAILYEGSGQIVYQYDNDTPAAHASPTVGIQNSRATDGLTYGCVDDVETLEPVRPAPESAVCFYDPDAIPKAAEPKALRFDSPVVNYGDIPPGAPPFVTERLAFDIPADAQCGDRIGISLHGVLFDGGFSPGPGNIYSAVLGGEDGLCDFEAPATAEVKANSKAFTRGMWFNPSRGGHGVDVHTQGDIGFLTWFTYGDDRTPTWYLAVGEHDNDQIHGELLRFTWDGSRATEEVVGEAVFTVLGGGQAMFNWTLDGKAGGEPFVELKGSGSPQSPNRTGHWFPPSQDGWGMTVNTQGQEEFDIVYFYDAAGEPAWVLGIKEGGGSTVSMEQFTGTCPDCVWVVEKSVSAGTFTRSFSGPRDGNAETDFTLKQPREGLWQRDVMIEILSDPVN